MYSTVDTRAANKARAGVVTSSTDARAAVIAGIGGRIPSPAHVPRLLQDLEMCSTTGAGAALQQELTQCAPPQGRNQQSASRARTLAPRIAASVHRSDHRPKSVLTRSRQPLSAQALRGLSCTASLRHSWGSRDVFHDANRDATHGGHGHRGSRSSLPHGRSLPLTFS